MARGRACICGCPFRGQGPEQVPPVWQALAEMYVAAEMWEDGAIMAAGHPDVAPIVLLPYARWLVAQRRLEDAREAFRCRPCTSRHPHAPRSTPTRVFYTRESVVRSTSQTGVQLGGSVAGRSGCVKARARVAQGCGRC